VLARQSAMIELGAIAKNEKTSAAERPTTRRFPLFRASGLSMFMRNYRARRHGRLHSSRAQRMKEKSPVTPSAISIQTNR
jgi:hypothetical protein